MKVGVIGSGAISDIYLSNMIEKFDNLDVVCIASRNLEHANAKAEKYGIAACTTKELLTNPDVEMVVNLTPVSVHYAILKAALEAGKHVYTEKTMTDDPATARELLELADAKGLYLGSAPDTFLGAALQTARAAIDSGLLGEIHSFAISANRDNSLLLSMFSFLRQPGCGLLYDYAVYYVTALVALLGPVVRVGSVIGTPYKTHVNINPQSPDFGKAMDTPNESQVSAVLTLEGGISGVLHVDNDSNLADQAYFAIYGTRGILYLTDPNGFGGDVRFLPNPVDPQKPEPAVTLLNFSQYGDNSRGLGPSEMADAIVSGRGPRASKELAYHVEEVLSAILAGGERGAFVDIQSRVDRPCAMPPAHPPVRNIGHVSLQMAHDEQMLHFYRDVLGMRELFTLTWGDQLSAMTNNIDDLDLSKLPEYYQNEIGGMLGWLKNKVKSLGERIGKVDSSVVRAIAQKPWITYMKLADRQYVELFHAPAIPRAHIGDRRKNYGYTKCNFEVDSIHDIRACLVDAGIELAEDIHQVVDGSLELTVFDPDGNEVQFTQYPQGPEAMIPITPDERESCSHVKYTTQVAYQVNDAANMEGFYCRGLGLRKVMTLTYADLYKAMKKSEDADAQALARVMCLGDCPWIDYIEVAPHQYLEFFHTPGEEKREVRDLNGYDGYQHICLEVDDIHAAWDACIANGLKPDQEISLGCEGAYQFWLTDPDGNRLEMMEYTATARQLS